MGLTLDWLGCVFEVDIFTFQSAGYVCGVHIVRSICCWEHVEELNGHSTVEE